MKRSCKMKISDFFTVKYYLWWRKWWITFYGSDSRIAHTHGLVAWKSQLMSNKLDFVLAKVDFGYAYSLLIMFRLPVNTTKFNHNLSMSPFQSNIIRWYNLNESLTLVSCFPSGWSWSVVLVVIGLGWHGIVFTFK